MSLFGSLYVGSSGLQAHQNALNTTAHNMSNIDTPGFVRQQVLFGNQAYNTLSRNRYAISNQQVGMGVNISKVTQVRNLFLDQRYREEAGRSAFYDTSFTVLSELETISGELYGKTFGNALSGLKDAAAELAKTPNGLNTQMLIQKASAFITKAGSFYKGLTDYQDNLNLQVQKSVNTINSYGKEIAKLNQKIVSVLAGGIESPNDLLDARNQLMDELGQLAKISYEEDSSGSVSISIEGELFLSGDSVHQIALDENPITGYYTPFWPQKASYTENANGTKKYDIEGAEVFDVARKISADEGTDIGHLRSLLYARGDHHANYADMADVDHYKKNISESLVMNAEAQLDKLVHDVATKINEIIAQASDPDTGYLCAADGSPLQIFQKAASPGYELGADGKWHYIAEDNPPNPANTNNLYSIKNLQFNSELMKSPDLMDLFKKDGSYDAETLGKLTAAFTEEEYLLNPLLGSKTTFSGCYDTLISQIAGNGAIYRGISANQQASVQEIENARQQVTGVSNDEEMTNMVKFQNAYNASSRFINVITEMMDNVINTLGRG